MNLQISLDIVRDESSMYKGSGELLRTDNNFLYCNLHSFPLSTS